MKVGILSCGQTPPEVAAKFGGYADMFLRLLDRQGFDFRFWDVEGMAFPDGPEDADGWLITGSRHGVYEDLPFIAPLEELVRQIDASGQPLVGICFGHQIVAQALGGTVVKFPRGWSVGPKHYDWDGLGDIHLQAWHQDQVIAPPAGARTIARNDFTEHAALLYDDRIFTVQPHPEFTAEIAGTYIAARRDDPAYPPGFLTEVETRLDQPTDHRRIGALMAGFLKQRTLANA